MSLTMHAVDEAAPIPRAVLLTLTCDSLHNHLAPIFESTDGYFESIKRAQAEGWMVKSERILCPVCSGKVPRQGSLL